MTGMALAHCILGTFLGVVCHCFPLAVYIKEKNYSGPDLFFTNVEDIDHFKFVIPKKKYNNFKINKS